MFVERAQKAIATLKRSRSAQKGTASDADKKRALSILKDDESSASALLVAIRILFGNQCIAWEPESIWIACESEHDVDVSTMNRNKLLAATTLIQTPRFYADANVFEKTCLAFNDVIAIPNAINEVSPGQLAWGIFEAQLLMQSEGTDPEFDHEPTRYTAVSLGRDGFILAPGVLSFAQQELNKRLRSPVEDTMRGVHEAWEEISKNENFLRNYHYRDTPVDVQLAKLASVELYVLRTLARYQKTLSELL